MIQGLREINVESEIKKVKTPTTVLFGEKDILLPKADAQLLAQTIPSSKFIEVEGGGHCLNVENPQRMAEYIKAELY